MLNELTQTIKKLAINSGSSACGITSTEPFREFDQALQDRLSQFPDATQLYIPIMGKNGFPIVRTSAPFDHCMD